MAAPTFLARTLPQLLGVNGNEPARLGQSMETKWVWAKRFGGELRHRENEGADDHEIIHALYSQNRAAILRFALFGNGMRQKVHKCTGSQQADDTWDRSKQSEKQTPG